MTTTTPILPLDVEGQIYLTVSALAPGSFYMPDNEIFEDSLLLDSKTGSRVPTFCFLIDHPIHGKALFDLGLRKHGKGYPPGLDDEMVYSAVECDEDIVDLLKIGNVSPREVSAVVYSHLHFDHVGNLDPFAGSLLVVGGEAKAKLQVTYPENPKSFLAPLPTGQEIHYITYEKASLSQPVDALGTGVRSLISTAPVLHEMAYFDRGIDVFHDGSFYLLDAPGHFPGHLNALLRVAANSFILLAGDCCHNRQCYTPGVRQMNDVNHADPPKAFKTLERVKKMSAMNNVIVILAHEKERLGEMPMFPSNLNEWAIQELSKKGNPF